METAALCSSASGGGGGDGGGVDGSTRATHPKRNRRAKALEERGRAEEIVLKS